MISASQLAAKLLALPPDAPVYIYQENDSAAAAAVAPILVNGSVLIPWDGINYEEGGL